MARPLRTAEEGSPSFADWTRDEIANILDGWRLPERFALGAIVKAIGAGGTFLDRRIPGPAALPAEVVTEGKAAGQVESTSAAGLTRDLDDPHPLAIRARGPARTFARPALGKLAPFAVQEPVIALGADDPGPDPRGFATVAIGEDPGLLLSHPLAIAGLAAGSPRRYLR